MGGPADRRTVLVVGSLEIVCRAWEGRTDLTYPKTLIAAALTVVLLANVSDHVLRAAQAGHPRSLLPLVGGLAALVPAAQLGSLHLMSGRLDSLGRATHLTTDPTAEPTTTHGPDAMDVEEPPPLDRAAIVAAVRSGRLSQELAATQVGRTTRTIRRWLAAEPVVSGMSHPASRPGVREWSGRRDGAGDEQQRGARTVHAAIKWSRVRR